MGLSMSNPDETPWEQATNEEAAKIKGLTMDEADTSNLIERLEKIDGLAKQTKRQRMDNYFVSIAILTAGLSHCVSYKVGAVLTFDDRIVATGYNGTVAGQRNCDDLFPRNVRENKKLRAKHHEFSLRNEVHAEMNAILDAGKRGTLKPGCTLYVTTMPCKDCAKLVAASGVKRVVYLGDYDLENPKESIDFFEKCGITIEKFNRNIEDERQEYKFAEENWCKATGKETPNGVYFERGDDGKIHSSDGVV